MAFERKAILGGFREWRNLNSPCSFHHCELRELNNEISPASTVLTEVEVRTIRVVLLLLLTLRQARGVRDLRGVRPPPSVKG